MSDKLKLSDPQGRDTQLQAVSDATELADDEKYIKRLEANVAALEKQLAQKIAQARPKAATSGGGAKIGARKDAIFKAIGTAPSINKTPVGSSMVPIPYPTVQDLSNSVGTARTVRFNGCPVYLLDNSTQPSGKGDERGTGKGIRSGTVTGEIKPVAGSRSVTVEGKKVVREGDACTMNGGNNPGIFVTTQTPSASPPKTAIETSNPYKKMSDAQLAADIAAVNGPPRNDNGLLTALKPTSVQQAVAAAMQRDALSGNGPGSVSPPTTVQQKQLASLQSSLGMHNLVPGSGNPRSPAQQFADENGMLYDSAMGGAAYGATRLVGGSDSAGRMFGAIGNGIDLLGNITSGNIFSNNTASKNFASSGLRIVQRGNSKISLDGKKPPPPKNINFGKTALLPPKNASIDNSPDNQSNPSDTAHDYGVAFFGEDNIHYYTSSDPTLGRSGRPYFSMPLEDSAMVSNAHDAARYTGMAPSAQKAYLDQKEIYGITYPTTDLLKSTPTAADAMGWEHFLEGGNTAVHLSDGPNTGFLLNPTKEFVIPGGAPIPEGSVLFQVGESGEWIKIKKYK